MENLEKPAENIENSTEQKNEWQEMAATAPEFNKEEAEEAKLEEAMDRLKNANNYDERLDALHALMKSGNIEGQEALVNRRLRELESHIKDLYSDRAFHKKMPDGKTKVKNIEQGIKQFEEGLAGYERFIKMTFFGKFGTI